MTLSNTYCVLLVISIDHWRKLIDVRIIIRNLRVIRTSLTESNYKQKVKLFQLSIHTNGKNRASLITFIIKTDSLLEPFNWKSTIFKTFAFYQTLLTGLNRNSSYLLPSYLPDMWRQLWWSTWIKQEDQDRKVGPSTPSSWLESHLTVKQPFSSSFLLH